MNKSARILVKILYLIYIAMVLFFCFYKFSSSDLDLGKYFLGIRMDRYAHFIMFFPYPFITWMTLKYSTHFPRLSRHSFILTILSGLAFAALTEICQDLFFQSRQGDTLDFAADSIAIITGTVTAYFTGPFMVKIVERLTKPHLHKATSLAIALILLPALCSGNNLYAADRNDDKDSIKAARNERLYGGEPVRSAVKLNASALVGIANPSFELRVHKNVSVALEAWGIFFNEGIGDWIQGPFNLGMAFVESRYYPIETFRGFFAGANVGFGFYCMTKGVHPTYWGSYPDSYQVGHNYMLGFTLGYSFTLTKHWAIELAIGGGYQNSTYEGHNLSDGSMYIGWNESAEWLLYKGALNIVYKW